MRYVRLLSLLAVPLLLAGCETMDSLVPDVGVSDIMGSGASSQPARTTGLAVADEPLAAQTGAAILAQGGSAADAATAMFFTMTATYPVAAGLGGGGICLVRDAQGRVSEFDFLPHAANAGGALAVPGAVAGFYGLQKVYGSLPWQRDVAPGEAFAATGFPISHVLAERLATTQTIVRLDPALSAEFLGTSSELKAEGAVVSNADLSVTLGEIRQNGADGFYLGSVGASLVAASAGEGGTISSAELAGYRSTQTQARLVALGSISAAMPGASTGAGAFSQRVLAGGRGTSDLAAATVAAVRSALASFNISSVPPDLGATGFAALDANGQAVSCGVTLNGPFGAGHTAGRSGVTLAFAPSAPTGISSAFLTPVIATDGNGVALAGAGTGGPNGTGAIVYALMRLATGQSVMRPGDLRSTGLAPLATVNAIACNGLCVALPDPGGNGLGSSVGDPPPPK
jgi:gamma-glutamyltranspeptidase / glutathione hydrolase